MMDEKTMEIWSQVYGPMRDTLNLEEIEELVVFDGFLDEDEARELTAAVRRLDRFTWDVDDIVVVKP